MEVYIQLLTIIRFNDHFYININQHTCADDQQKKEELWIHRGDNERGLIHYSNRTCL